MAERRGDGTGMTAEEIVELSKRFTLYDWQAQANATPIPVDRAEGIYFWAPKASATSTSTAS